MIKIEQTPENKFGIESIEVGRRSTGVENLSLTALVCSHKKFEMIIEKIYEDLTTLF